MFYISIKPGRPQHLMMINIEKDYTLCIFNFYTSAMSQSAIFVDLF